MHNSPSNRKIVPQSAPTRLFWGEAKAEEEISDKCARSRTQERDSERSALFVNCCLSFTQKSQHIQDIDMYQKLLGTTKVFSG